MGYSTDPLIPLSKIETRKPGTEDLTLPESAARSRLGYKWVCRRKQRGESPLRDDPERLSVQVGPVGLLYDGFMNAAAQVRTAKRWSPARQFVYTALAQDAKMEILA